MKVLRFTNDDIDNRIEWVIEQIKGETGKGVDGIRERGRWRKLAIE
jgi:very-short-patch-repair endonuclease